jgi:SAM-dependent methyltransferase
MMDRVRARPVATALDVGCGEGRFCRMLAAAGIAATGIDPTDAFLLEARRRDPDGDYRRGRAEALDFPAAAFDLVVSYITLVDIPDIRTATAEMARVLRPGGRLLIANLNSFSTAAVGGGWTADASGEPRFSIDHYLTERAEWVEWRGVRVINHHRPLSTYLTLLLGAGLRLTYFSEPAPSGGDPEKAGRYRRVPYYLIMEWEKPASSRSPSK